MYHVESFHIIDKHKTRQTTPADTGLEVIDRFFVQEAFWGLITPNKRFKLLFRPGAHMASRYKYEEF